MFAGARGVLVVAILGTGAAVGLLPAAARAREPNLPPAPVPALTPPTDAAADQAPGPLQTPSVLPGSPPSGLPAVPPPPPPPPAPPLYGVPDPGQFGWGPYGPPSPPPGFFFSVEVEILRPFLKDRVENDAPLPISGGFLQLPAANLNWTAAPWFEAGYRLPESWGYFAAGYRFLDSDGSATVPYAGLPTAVHTRLGLSMGDLDYGATQYQWAPRWTWDWRVGLRAADVFFDTRAVNALANQQTTNSFRGLGPHGRLDLYRYLDSVPGLALFGRTDGAVLLGRISQKFRNTALGPGGTPAFYESYEQNGTQAVPMLILQAGLSYTPPGYCNWHFAGGYFFEHWWYVGQLGLDSTSTTFAAGPFSASRGEVGSQGVFLRARVDF